MDLIAVGRSALLPDDDLTLAAALKSPLVGLDDDALMALAPRRAGSLAQALAKSAERAVRAGATPRRDVAPARRRTIRPTCSTRVSSARTADGARCCARLGPEAADAIDEFMALALAHERKAAPSLQRVPRGNRGDGFRHQARHGGRRRQRARDDGPRRQGPGSADRVPARHVFGAPCAQRRQAARPRRRRRRRSAALRLGDETGRQLCRRWRPRAKGRARPPRANIAACSTSR